MKIKLNIFYPALLDSIHSTEGVIVNGNTVGDCLKDFIRQYPGSEKWIFNSRGELFEHLLIYINAESTHGVALNDAIKEGDVLLLVAMIAGG